MKMVLATHNTGKLTELRVLLEPCGHTLLSLDDAGISEVPEENGGSFEANARIKALACCRASGLPSIADDSGLCVDALDGAPGVNSARWAEPDQLIDKLLAEMSGVQRREARFECAIVCAFPDGSELYAKGECGGVILERRRGQGGFGYDPVFFVPELGLTFAQMDSAQKNLLSHRGKAIREFVRKMEESF